VQKNTDTIICQTSLKNIVTWVFASYKFIRSDVLSELNSAVLYYSVPVSDYYLNVFSFFYC